MTLPLEVEEFEALQQRWKDGELIQNVFTMLTADQREFLMTGCSPQEWDEMFKE